MNNSDCRGYMALADSFIKFCENSDANISQTARNVWFTLSHMFFDNGRRPVEIPTRYLMEMCGVKSDRSFKAARQQLEEIGFLEYKPGNGRNPSRYIVTPRENMLEDGLVFDPAYEQADLPGYMDYYNRAAHQRLRRREAGKSDSDIAALRMKEFEELEEFWHQHCGNMSDIKKMSGKRRNHIRSVRKEYTMDEIRQAILKAEQSDWLNHRNEFAASGKGCHFKADFDWVLGHITELLEERYDNRPGGKPEAEEENEHFIDQLTAEMLYSIDEQMPFADEQPINRII